jgi:glycosyltransferase involved in cell wall biosynthesis
MEKFRFHLLSLPHTSTTKEFSLCAYTTKIRRFADMMTSLGHEVFLYAGPENEAEVTEHIVVASEEDQLAWFGDCDWRKTFFNITWDPNDIHWKETNHRSIEEIKKRIQPRDFILIAAGVTQKEVADAFPENLSVEPFIGYTGTFSRYRVFESVPHQHYVYGLQQDDNGHFFDSVIPNYFDPDEFPVKLEKGDYFLFIGRLIQRKGPEIAVEVTRRIGAKLIMAGQGVAEQTPGRIVAEDGMVYEGEHISHIGSVGPIERAELMGGARATFVPTTYLEPFGGVSIESLMCGTPVIAPDFGVFPTTIEHGVDGFRFSTIGEATWAAENVENLDYSKIAERAMSRFSTDRVKWQFQAYFEQLFTLWNEGFYSDWDKGVSEYRRYEEYGNG